MLDKVIVGLEITGLGMAGIFIAILVIMGIVYIMQKTEQKKK